MLLSLWTLFVALVLSVIAAYYSVIGLATIFSAAQLPVIIMSASMEVAKVTTAVWLHHYWKPCKLVMRLYLVSAVIMLSCITSMGIFGLLSRAHADQGAISADISEKVSILDEKIRTEKENIDSARQALTQMNTGVNETIARSTTEQSVNRAVQLRKNQAKERTELQKSITSAQDRIAALNNERAPFAAQMRKVESEVGPVKYIAAMIYGDNPDVTTLERAVRWVIILLVIVFDPLAITMVLAANESIKWTRAGRKENKDEEISREESWERCPECNTPLELAPGIGHYCPNEKCDRIDDLWEEPVIEPVIEPIVEEPVIDEIIVPEVIVDAIEPIIEEPVIEPESIEEIVEEYAELAPETIVEVYHPDQQTSKDASKVWKKQNPDKTLKEQLHYMANGEIDHLPWEDKEFIENNLKK